MSKLSNYFTWAEAACNDGTAVPKEYRQNAILLGRRMDIVRDWFGAPITPISWYRYPEYNDRVGGEPASFHLTASAMDFVVQGWDPRVVYRVMERLIANNTIPDGGLGKYSGWTHYDTRTGHARWSK